MMKKWIMLVLLGVCMLILLVSFGNTDSYIDIRTDNTDDFTNLQSDASYKDNTDSFMPGELVKAEGGMWNRLQ